MKKVLTLLCCTALLVCCQNSNEEKSKRHGYDIDDKLPPSGKNISVSEKEARVANLVYQSKQTMDSIDAAYKTIRKESRMGTLSADEREKVNEVLIDLSDARDLFVLQMQETVINTLKEKTAALEGVMGNMESQSQKMLNIAATVNRVSNIIKKTTMVLADALSFGIVRPRLEPAKT